METARVEDGQSGRFAEVPPPLTEYLSPSHLVELEQAVRTSFNILKHDEADQEFSRIASRDPVRLMYGLLWLTAMWSSLSAARIGVTVARFSSALGYRGQRFDLSDESEQSWATGEQALRRGVLAVATSVEDTHECLEIYGRLDPGLGRLRWIMLAIMDGLTQDMERNGVAPWGATAHVIRVAGWTAPA